LRSNIGISSKITVHLKYNNLHLLIACFLADVQNGNSDNGDSLEGPQENCKFFSMNLL
jgi:hypothetical protein